MKNIATSLTDLIGNTPILELQKYNKLMSHSSKIFAKLEYMNPSGSVKCRVGNAMIHDAEKANLIDKDTVIIEPTSGNTGIALAFAAAVKGYRLILTMPETMSIERRKLVAAYGAEVVLTPGEEGMNGAINKALSLSKEIPNSYIPQQFENSSNPEIHRQTTALEILRDMDKDIDYFVACVGTGGTLTGIGEVLKSEIPHVKIVAVEPKDSAVLSSGKPGPHKIQGIGAGFIPKILNTSIIDRIIQIDHNDAFDTSRLIAKKEGLLMGISSGAALYAANMIAKEEKGKNIVVILPDSGERYLSTELFQL